MALGNSEAFPGPEESIVSSTVRITTLVKKHGERARLGKDRLFRQMIEFAPQRCVLGRAVRYDIHDLDAWIAAHKCRPTVPA